MTPAPAVGTLALVGGGEWRDGCRELDAELLATCEAKEVFVLPTAAAFEHPERVVERAAAYFEGLGAKVRPLMVLRRADADDPKLADSVRKARLVYLSDGSPLHLRSVLKGMPNGELRPGTRVGGLRIVKKIGEGGLSVVYLAEGEGKPTTLYGKMRKHGLKRDADWQ